jgi:hypothetical protein
VVETDMGGPRRDTDAAREVTALRRLIEAFGPNYSGEFY